VQRGGEPDGALAVAEERGRRADRPRREGRVVEVGEVEVARVLPVIGLLRRQRDGAGEEDVEREGAADEEQREALRGAPRRGGGLRGRRQILRAVWCSSSTISPSLNTRTVPVVCDTVIATAFVSPVTAAAAEWRAPRPIGTFAAFETTCR
jgi:hypothetical protein